MKSAIALLLFAASAAFAQTRESVTVELIEVPVYVTAADGTPVRGLPKEAFSLRVDGKPREIEYFEEIGGETSQPRSAAAPQLHQRRLYLLLFDLFFTRPNDLVRAQHAADALVARANPDTDAFAVATYTARDGIQFVIPFLTDRVAVRRAVATLAPSDAHDALGIATKQAERALVMTDNYSQVQETGNRSADIRNTLLGGDANRESLAEPRRHFAEHQLAGLAAAAERMRALEGQKHVVLLSSGFGPYLFGEFVQQSRFRTDIAQIYRAFADAGVFLDAVDTFGVRPLDSSEPLRQLTSATGGTLISGENDVGRALARLTSLQQSVYRLGFMRRDNRAGTIEVRVGGAPRGARVSYRTGYGKAAAEGPLDALQLADIIANDIPQNGLSVTLNATPRGAITAAFNPAEASVADAYLYVVDEQGATVFSKATRVSDALREQLKLPPGRYVVKVLMNAGGTLGFARTDLIVP